MTVEATFGTSGAAQPQASKSKEVISVASVLSASKFKPATVEKEDDLEYDLGSLLASDSHPVPNELTRAQDNSEGLDQYTRDNVQLLFNRIFSLPTKTGETGLLVQIPPPQTVLPREKHVPLPKRLTRMEEYAKQKGFQLHGKRSRMVWDELAGDYRPRYGYGRTNKEKDTWIVEAKPDAKPGDMDPFLEMRQHKRKLAAEQLDNRAKNIIRSKTSLQSRLPREKVESGLRNTLNQVSVSTASMGRFDKPLDGGKKPAARAGERKTKKVGKMTGDQENTLRSKVADRLLAKEKTLVVDKAVSGFRVAADKERHVKLKDKVRSGKKLVERRKQKQAGGTGKTKQLGRRSKT